MTLEELAAGGPGDWFYDVGDQLRRHVYDRTLAAIARGDARRDVLAVDGDFTAYQQALTASFRASLGGLPDSDTPLQARTVGVIRAEGFRIEKIVYESRPKHFVTANLYLPDRYVGPGPAVLFLCGHHRDAKHQPEYQGVCQRICRRGIVVLAQDPLGQGERWGYGEAEPGRSTVSWGTTEHDHAGAQALLLGDTLGRYFAHDAIRGLDLLAERPEVDPARIGVTGNSGGGTQTSLLLLCAAERIAAAAPATFIFDRASYLLAGGPQDAEQIWPGFTSAGYDHEDILLTMAPKPVRVLAVQQDFFPIEGTRRTVARAARIWSRLGAADRLDLIEDDEPHWFTDKLAEAAATFFAERLGSGVEAPLFEVSLFPPEQLWCTISGQVRGEIPGARFVHDENLERLDALPVRGRGNACEAVILHERRPCGFNRRFYAGPVDVDGVLTARKLIWWAQEGVFNHGVLLRRADRDDLLSVTLAFWDGGTRALTDHADWIRTTCSEGRAVLVVDTSGVGALTPHPVNRAHADDFYGTNHKMATDLIFLGDSLGALRAFDARRAAELATTLDGVAFDGKVFVDGYHGAAAWIGLVDTCQRVGGTPTSFENLVRSRDYEHRGLYGALIPGFLKVCGRRG